jgi:hypothetical protein
VTTSETVSHILFIDDVWVSIYGSLREMSSLSKTLELFCKATGMKINLEKSRLLTSLCSGARLPPFYEFFLFNINRWMRG